MCYCRLLNVKAKILTCQNSSIDIKEILNTNFLNAADFDLSPEQMVEEDVLDCYLAAGESRCSA